MRSRSVRRVAGTSRLFVQDAAFSSGRVGCFRVFPSEMKIVGDTECEYRHAVRSEASGFAIVRGESVAVPQNRVAVLDLVTAAVRVPVSGRAVRDLLVPVKFFDSKGDAPGAAARVVLVEYELEVVLGGLSAFASCLSSGFDPACVLRALELDTAVFELIVHRPPILDTFLEPFTDLLRGLAVCWQAPTFFGCPQRIDVPSDAT